MEVSDATSLTSHDWARAALDAIAVGGVASVTVEGIARRLGVTKGSFYWHLADRRSLVAAAVEVWEQEATLEVIEGLGRIADPVERLRALFDVSFGDVIDGPIDAALVTMVDDEVVGPVVRRVTATRIGFLEELYRDLCMSRAKAAARARVAYSTYVGHHQLRRAAPDDALLAAPSKGYLRHVLATLTANA